MNKKLLLLGSLVIMLGMLVFPVGVAAASHSPNVNGPKPPKITAPPLTEDTFVPPAQSNANGDKTNNGNHNGSDKGNKTGQNKNEQNTNNGNGQKGAVQVYKGTIESLAAPTFSITLVDGSLMEFTADDQTQVKVPTMKDATLDSLAVGEQVIVQTRTSADDVVTVVKILLVPGKPPVVHRVGMVTDYSPASGDSDGSITIQDQADDTFTFTVTVDTKILPTGTTEVNPGDLVTIIAPRNPATPTAQLTANGIVVHGPASGDTDETGESE